MWYYLDLFGTAVFAVSGALAGGRRRLDLFGVMVLATVTAIGGGTLRDLLLDARPVFWLADQAYLYLSFAAALVVFFWARLHQLEGWTLPVCDAFGLAVFTVIGTQKALGFGHGATVAVIMGILTGVAGGMLRDLLSGEVPLVLRKEIYATASLSGAVVLVGTEAILGRPVLAGWAAVAVILVLRLAAIRWGLKLPTFLSVERWRRKNHA